MEGPCCACLVSARDDAIVKHKKAPTLRRVAVAAVGPATRAPTMDFNSRDYDRSRTPSPFPFEAPFFLLARCLSLFSKPSMPP